MIGPIAIIDYGGGNTGSLYAAMRRITAEVVLTNDPAAVRNARATVLPGDGAFGATIAALRERSLLPEIERFLESGRPFLGICVGMQILYEGSAEFGQTPGLGFFTGQISRFRNVARIPNIGWSKITVQKEHPILECFGEEEYAYFMHSYRADRSPETIAVSDLAPSEPFTAICARDNVVGMQFHPEKSQTTGAKLLTNFVRMSTLPVKETV